MRLPDFLIIGAQKAATTWLHQQLRQHPRIYLPEAKDGGFFCWQDNDEPQALQDYAQAFRSAPADALVGESTAAYFWTHTGSHFERKPPGYHADVPAHVRTALGGRTRLLLTLRDPVDRAVSAYLHYRAMGELPSSLSLSEALQHGGIVDIGLYAIHLRNWLRHFPREQLCVLIKERDVDQSPKQGLARALEHLGLATDWRPSGLSEPVFAGTARHWHDDGVWVDDNSGRRQIVSAEEIQFLRGLFREDIAQTQVLLSEPLTELWQ